MEAPICKTFNWVLAWSKIRAFLSSVAKQAEYNYLTTKDTTNACVRLKGACANSCACTF